MGARHVASAMAIATTIAIAGCGLGPGPGTSQVTLTVTRGFGAMRVGSIQQRRVPGSETVMRMLQRSFRISTRYGGGFVESINGLSGSSQKLDWFYYVNGILAPVGAAGTTVHRGDRIWWDLHDWLTPEQPAAAVGSFPEPFLHGVGGKRLPTTLECAADVSAPCKRVGSELTAMGIPVASQLIGTGSGADTLGVVVGTWSDLRAELVARLVEHGPSASGIYARFGGGGKSVALLDPRGRVVQTLGSGAGLIAATAQGSANPIWLITGTDPAGVAAAARAMTPARLRDHFALAVKGSADLPIPLRGAL